MSGVMLEGHSVTLRSPRLGLRPLTRADLDAMAAWPPFTAPLDQEWNWPRRMQERGLLDLFFASHAGDASRRAWTIREGSQVVGLVQLSQIRRPEADARLGIALGAPWIGRGYGQEALGVFLDACFGPIQLRTLGLEVALANERAVKLYRRLGFEETKRFWRDAGGADDYGFLDEQEYTGVRQYFRRANGGVYQMYAEMMLSRG